MQPLPLQPQTAMGKAHVYELPRPQYPGSRPGSTMPAPSHPSGPTMLMPQPGDPRIQPPSQLSQHSYPGQSTGYSPAARYDRILPQIQYGRAGNVGPQPPPFNMDLSGDNGISSPSNFQALSSSDGSRPSPVAASPHTGFQSSLVAGGGGSGSSPHSSSDTLTTTVGEKLLGPVAGMDADFFASFIKRGLATQEDSKLDPAKSQLYERLFRVSNDPALPIYKIAFVDQDAMFEYEHRIAQLDPKLVNDLQRSYDAYGTEIVETFARKFATHYRVDPAMLKTSVAEAAAHRRLSFLCAACALGAMAVDSWPLRKRIAIAQSWHQYNMTCIGYELRQSTPEFIKAIVMTADFPLQEITSTGLMAAVDKALEMKLHIDPRHWRISESEKSERRRLWSMLLTKERLCTLFYSRPTISSDAYDTALPTATTRSDEAALIMHEAARIISDIMTALYSIKGARLLHDNQFVARLLSKQFCEQAVVLRVKFLKMFPAFEHMPDAALSLEAAFCLLHIEFCIVLATRALAHAPKLPEVDKLENTHQLVLGCVSICELIFRMPDSFFSEVWMPSCCYILMQVTFELLRALTGQLDDQTRELAHDALDRLIKLGVRMGDKWHSAKHLIPLMRLRPVLLDRPDLQMLQETAEILKHHYNYDTRRSARSVTSAPRAKHPKQSHSSSGPLKADDLDSGHGSNLGSRGNTTPRMSVLQQQAINNGGDHGPGSTGSGSHSASNSISGGCGAFPCPDSNELSPWQMNDIWPLPPAGATFAPGPGAEWDDFSQLLGLATPGAMFPAADYLGAWSMPMAMPITAPQPQPQQPQQQQPPPRH
ncbi:hypothetical protein PYCC9005_001511 [Savitreella phatthalungensis]